MKNLITKIAIVAIAFVAFSCSSPDEEKSLKPVSILEIAKATPEMSSFVEAVEAAGLTSTLDSPGDYTVFMPNNDAFASVLGGISAADYEIANPGVLAKVLKFHVLSSRALSTDLTDGMDVTTLEGQSFKIGISVPDPLLPNDNVISINAVDPFDTNDPPASITSTIIARDVKCSNGIVHPVDTILLPLSILN